MFVMYVAIWKWEKMLIHSKKQAQINDRTSIFHEAPIVTPAKSSDYSNISLSTNTRQLVKHTKINDHIINLEENKQPLIGLINNIKPVKLETLKTYIKTILANGFIQSSKSHVGAFIFFHWKPNRSFCLNVNY